MVAKINIGSSLYGALAYNGEKINEGEGKLLLSNKLLDDGTGKVDINKAMQDFERYIPSIVRTKKPVIHISLNPHPDDKLTDTELAEMAAEYMEQLGYGEQPYLVFKHEDIGREHLHIVSLRVTEDGKLLDNTFINRRSKRITDELEKKYSLTPSSRQKSKSLPELKKVDASQGDIKKQIAGVIRYATDNYRFQTLGEYRALLSLYNITVEETRGCVPHGQLAGREYHGLVYSATDDKGEKVGTPIKSSKFGKYAGYSSLEQHFAYSKESIATYKPQFRTQKAIRQVMRQTHDRDKFVAELHKLGVDAIFRTTDTGRIYGATFIDHNTGAVLNGSRIGKEFSANAFEEHFSISPRSAPITIGQYDSHELQEQTAYNKMEESDGLGLFNDTATGDDPEEDMFRRRMQRKKKKGRRL